jgi:ubiquitin thioesterase OTU1
MARLRLRHPNGMAQLDIDVEISTVLDLQQRIKTETGILPSRQVRA